MRGNAQVHHRGHSVHFGVWRFAPHHRLSTIVLHNVIVFYDFQALYYAFFKVTLNSHTKDTNGNPMKPDLMMCVTD